MNNKLHKPFLFAYVPPPPLHYVPLMVSWMWQPETPAPLQILKDFPFILFLRESWCQLLLLIHCAGHIFVWIHFMPLSTFMLFGSIFLIKTSCSHAWLNWTVGAEQINITWCLHASYQEVFSQIRPGWFLIESLSTSQDEGRSWLWDQICSFRRCSWTWWWWWWLLLLLLLWRNETAQLANKYK